VFGSGERFLEYHQLHETSCLRLDIQLPRNNGPQLHYLAAVGCKIAASSGQVGVSTDLISLVDDDASVRRSTTLLIESLGFRAAAFESAERFLESDQLHDTSCLILDIQLPRMNGLQLQSHLAARGYKIPIIFITACDGKESRRQAMQAGAVAFMGKPFSAELLFQTIRKAL